MRFFRVLGKSILNIIYSFLVIFLLILFYSFVSIYILRQDYVNFLGYTFFEVTSGSMSPSIKSLDGVVVKINDHYHEGDIITYKRDDDYITHRVVNIHDSYVITRGDANYINDDSINSSDVIGRVVYIWHNVGIIKKVLFSSRVVIMLIITLILFGYTYSYDSNLFKRFRMRRLSRKKIRVFKKEIRDGHKKERLRKEKRSIKRGNKSAK